MKIITSLLVTVLTTASASAQFVVQDPFVLAQKLIEMARQGDPAAIQRLAGFDQLSQSLVGIGAGLSLKALQEASAGLNAFDYTGNGLYRPILDRVVTPAGIVVPRSEPDYRKFDAVAMTTLNFKEVQKNVEGRASELRRQVRDTITQVLGATTRAEVQKLQALLASQGAQLASLERERDAALARVLVQDVENRNDQQRQQQARIEERAAAFQSAQSRLGRFLSPGSAPLTIPAPRTARP